MYDKVRSRVRLKRAYDAPARSDGRRILVDHIWPRGVTKAKLQLDDWLKDLAPSAKLRKWFDHDPAKWATFKKRYFKELDERGVAIARALASLRRRTVTLIFAAKDIRCNNAVALKEYLGRHAKNIVPGP